MAESASDIDVLSIVQARWSRQVNGSAIYKFLLAPATIISASKGLVISRLTLTKDHINSKGGLHGSVSATIVDAFGGLAITSWDGREKTGPSVDINVSYLGMAGEGDEVEIEGRVEKVGGSLGFTSVKISKVKGEENKEVIVLGRHTKFVRGTAPEK
jgi:acyl-coenzyme A thioesterase 13